MPRDKPVASVAHAQHHSRRKREPPRGKPVASTELFDAVSSDRVNSIEIRCVSRAGIGAMNACDGVNKILLKKKFVDLSYLIMLKAGCQLLFGSSAIENL